MPKAPCSGGLVKIVTPSVANRRLPGWTTPGPQEGEPKECHGFGGVGPLPQAAPDVRNQD